MIPYGRQDISMADLDSVQAALKADFLTTGPRVAEFEARIADLVGARHVVAVNSATAALHLAMRVADIGQGDGVLTSPITFLASANCAAYVDATPDFADIDPVSYNLCPEALEKSWSARTKAVVAVDYAGQPCDMPRIAEIARLRGAVVIEDACHGFGGGFSHDGRAWKLGGHPWADMTVFSFHPVKTLTTGEGGALVTDNAQWAERARRLRSHGIERQQFVGLGADSTAAFSEHGPWYYEMQELGYNYRLTDVQCALGISQLNRLAAFIERRRQIVARYNAAFADVPWMTTPGIKQPADADRVSWHLYTVQIDFPQLGHTRSAVMKTLRERGIGSQVLYIPVYLQPWYRQKYHFAPGKCPQAEAFYARALSLPLYPAMSDSDVERVIAAVRELGQTKRG